LAIQVVYLFVAVAQMIGRFHYAVVCNAFFSLNGVIFIGMIIASLHTVFFGVLTYNRRLEAPKPEDKFSGKAEATQPTIEPGQTVQASAGHPVPIAASEPVRQLDDVRLETDTPSQTVPEALVTPVPQSSIQGP
jgi:hypothetical protein